jgi:hypothetical protein
MVAGSRERAAREIKGMRERKFMRGDSSAGGMSRWAMLSGVLATVKGSRSMRV